MGGSRMKVACKDGKERMCRIPGKLRNRVWVRDGDVVIVKPFEIEGDKKGDVIWRYFPLSGSASPMMMLLLLISFQSRKGMITTGLSSPLALWMVMTRTTSFVSGMEREMSSIFSYR